MKQPFFIVGTGRCGSTLLYNILQAHDRVALTNESRIVDFLHFFANYSTVPAPDSRIFPLLEEVKLHGLIRKPYVKRFSDLVVKHAKQMLEEFYAEEFADRDFTHWGDKLPSAHAAQAVSDIYPNTKYVLLIRDPRDFVASARAYMKRPNVRKRSPFFIGGLDLETQCRMWYYTYRGSLDYLKKPLVVRYEDLVRDPLRMSRKVMDYLGLELQVDQIAKMTSGHQFAGHGTSSTPQSSVGRWQNDLRTDEIETIESICGELMVAQGYEPATAPAFAPKPLESNTEA